MRTWTLVLVLVAFSYSGTGFGQSRPDRPNIVLIMTDDLGWADVSSYGATDLQTPNIDSLARDGIRLSDFYSNGVLCSPTRAALISGRYQQRYGIETALPHRAAPNSDRGLPASAGSMPGLVKAAGYATALIGKWHLGYLPQFSPDAHGFEYFFGLKSGFHDYYRHTDGGGNPDLFENDAAVDMPGYTTDLITERAVKFIEQNAGRSFFIDVSYNAPHWPYQVPGHASVARDNGRHLMAHDDPTSTRADYVAMVEQVDRGVGEILSTLDRLQLNQNTIVIFTNDNGGEWLSDNGPLFNRKWTVWEGGIRVPALIRWPGRIPAGKVSDQVGMTMDLTASILAATGARVPPEARHDGMNLLPIWEGKAPEVDRTLFWRTNAGGRTQKAVRSGDWKLVVDGTHTFVFNVRGDVGERVDLASRRQDIARKLRSLLNEWERDVDAEAKSQPPKGPSGASGFP